jgi:hypothetical protein
VWYAAVWKSKYGFLILRGGVLQMADKKEVHDYLSIVNNKIHVLMVGEDMDEIEILFRILEGQSIFVVSHVATTNHAKEIIGNGCCFHACICFIGDDENEEAACDILQTYGNKTPILYVSNRGSVKTGFNLGKAGALGVCEKPLTPNDCIYIISLIKKALLDRILLPPCGYLQDEIVGAWCAIIRKKVPLTVSQLILETRVDDSYFRKRWKKYFGVKPKIVIMLYGLFYYAFTYVESVLQDQRMMFSYTQLEHIRVVRNYYVRNEKKLDSILFRGGGISEFRGRTMKMSHKCMNYKRNTP